MNIKTVSYIPAGVIAAGAAMVVFLFAATLVRADVAPVLTTVVHNSSHSTTTAAQIGTSVHANVVVASSTSATSPTGTVDVSLYNNTSCVGTPTIQSAVALTHGIAESAAAILPAGGLSYKVHYNGDASTTAADGSCAAITATASSVTLNTALSTTTSVLAGSTINDTATLGNATADATGTVAYTVYTNNVCSTGAQSAGTKTVANALVPNSDAVLFNTAGTYYWQAVYSGDQHNSPATSSCQGEILTVVATSTPVVPPPTTPGTISGTVFNDQNSNDIKDGSELGLTGWKVWLHQGNNYNGTIVQTATTDSNGNYTFSNLGLGTYFVEEQVQSGWNQTTDDKAIMLDSTHTSGSLNFGNVQTSVASTTDHGRGHGRGHCDGNNDADDIGCPVASSTSQGHGHGFGTFMHDFIKSHFQNGHVNSGTQRGDTDQDGD